MVAQNPCSSLSGLLRHHVGSEADRPLRTSTEFNYRLVLVSHSQPPLTTHLNLPCFLPGIQPVCHAAWLRLCLSILWALTTGAVLGQLTHLEGASSPQFIDGQGPIRCDLVTLLQKDAGKLSHWGAVNTHQSTRWGE